MSSDDAQRYARHLALPEVGEAGQHRLQQARVLLVGAGGLGSPAALYLAAAGVGTIGVIDPDAVELSNLQRQILHGTPDVGAPKTTSAARRIAELNPGVRVVPHPVRLTSTNAMQLLNDYDVVVDGSDNFATRYLVNDACVLLGKPDVYGSVHQFDGQASVFCTRAGPCYRCLYPTPPPPGMAPSCAAGGVLGVLPGLIGVLQATEAIKYILGIGESLAGRLLLYDALAMSFRTLRVARDPHCPACGEKRTITSLQDYEAFCGTPKRETNMDITPKELKAELARPNPPRLLDVREESEWKLGRLPGAQWIPLGQLEARLGELDPSANLVCYCKAGGRSARAIALLQSKGFKHLRNLAGGILAWSDQVDPSIPKY